MRATGWWSTSGPAISRRATTSTISTPSVVRPSVNSGGYGDLVILDKSNQSIWDLFEKTVDPQGRTVGKVPAGKYYILRVNEEADFIDSRKIGLVGGDDVIGRAVAALPF